METKFPVKETEQNHKRPQKLEGLLSFVQIERNKSRVDHDHYGSRTSTSYFLLTLLTTKLWRYVLESNHWSTVSCELTRPTGYS